MGTEIVITCPPANKPILFAAASTTTYKSHMQIQPCARPTDQLETAPLTDLSVHMGFVPEALSAFWGGDDAYYIRAVDASGEELWFCTSVDMDSGSAPTATEAASLTAQLATVLPLAAGRPTFEVGSAGRTVYRVWRTPSATNGSRTKIRAVRAARSRRLPA